MGFALQIMQLLPLVMQGVGGAMELFQWGQSKVESFGEDGKPTQADWDELHARRGALQAKLHSDDA